MRSILCCLLCGRLLSQERREESLCKVSPRIILFVFLVFLFCFIKIKWRGGNIQQMLSTLSSELCWQGTASGKYDRCSATAQHLAKKLKKKKQNKIPSKSDFRGLLKVLRGKVREMGIIWINSIFFWWGFLSSSSSSSCCHHLHIRFMKHRILIFFCRFPLNLQSHSTMQPRSP